MEINPTSKEFENENKKVNKQLEKNISPSTCCRKIKPSYIIILSIFSLIIITLIILLCLIMKKNKIKSATTNINYYKTLPDMYIPTEIPLETYNSYKIPDIKCLIENCKICEKDINNNTCLECIPSYIPKYKNNKIISCDSKVIKEDIDESIMLYNNLSGENIINIKNMEPNNTKNISIIKKSLK